MKTFAKRLAIKLNEEISEEQAGFLPGKGTRDQIMNLKMVLEENRERGNDVFLCFIDYSTAFDTVAHDILWNDVHKMGFPTLILLLIKVLCDQQKAAVTTSHGLPEWFEIGQGGRHECILSQHLFNFYAETVMRNALENLEGSITVGGHKITNLRYADDVVLLAGSLEELQDLVNRVKLESEKVGLFPNTRKTKVMKVQQNLSDGCIVI